jgi:hypothetical protein
LHPPWNQGRTGIINNIFMTKWSKLPLRNNRALQDRPALQMRTITYNDEAAPCNMSNQLMGLLPSNDAAITTSLEPSKNRSEIMNNQAPLEQSDHRITSVTGTVQLYILFVSCLILCLYKAKAPIVSWRWLKMGWVLTFSPPHTSPVAGSLFYSYFNFTVDSSRF